MATNEILPFASDGSANVLSQSAYAADGQRVLGNQPGIARAQLNNKALRQLSVLVAGFAQFLANRQATNVTDSLTLSQVETVVQSAFASTSTLPATISNTPASWWRKQSDGYMEQGIAGIAVASSGAHTDVTFPVAFTTTVLDIQCSVFDSAQQQVGWGLLTLTGVRIFTGNGDANARTVNILVRGY